ncbi:YtpR family tRNA-binding protein [Streptococcus rifensis]
MIYTYNKPYVGDVLMVIVADSQGQKVTSERRDNVAVIRRAADNQVVGVNIFDVSNLITIDGQGQVSLSADDLAVLNQAVAQAGFELVLEDDGAPKFVVGEIVSMETHPDSDHLNICQVAIGAEETVQIVAGAPNAAVGLKTIVALPGAMMPKGNLIFPGELRGVASHGMMCSPRELALPNAPQKRGIIELALDTAVGEPFDASKHWG